MDRSRPLDICKIETCSFIQHKVIDNKISTNKAIQLAADELEIPFSTIKKWIYPASGIRDAERKREKRANLKVVPPSDQLFNDDVGEDIAQLEFLEEVIANKKKNIVKKYATEKREIREEENKKIKDLKQPPLPEDKYNVLYIDCPWRYDFAETDNRKIENHYPTMDIEEICNLPIQKLAADDCVLFLWATAPKLEEAFNVIKSWGFKYKTCAVWDKKKIGMGYWFRGQHEILMVATKGHVSPPLPENRYSSIFSIPREKHSQKPVDFYEIISTMMPNTKKIELFARNKIEGWYAWGNQIEA